MKTVGPGARPPTWDPGETRLAACLQAIDSELIHVNPDPRNLEHLVSGVLMRDPMDPAPQLRNLIVFAVGMGAVGGDFEHLLHVAAAEDAAAVVVKARGASLDQIAAAAKGRPVAVLVAPDTADWTILASLARGSLAGVGTELASGIRLGDVYALANAVASLTDVATSIVDPVGRIVGYSTLPGQPIDELRRRTTLSLEELVHPAFDPDFKTVYASSGAVYVASEQGDADRLAIAVRVGGELLGSIWLIDPGPRHRERVSEVLAQVEPLVGLHLLHARAASDFGNRRDGDLVRTMMSDPANAAFAAAQLGVGTTERLAVAAFAFIGPRAQDHESLRDLQRLLHVATTTCSIQLGAAHCALIDGVVYALLPFAERKVHRRVAGDIVTYAQTLGARPVVGAVGGIAESLAGLPSAQSEALDCLHYLSERVLNGRPGVPAETEAPRVALFEDHRAQLGLIRVGELMTASGTHDDADIEVIRSYDADHGTDYLDTLRTFLESAGSISAVAAALHVHSNTVRYRLARLCDEFGIDLGDPDSRLWLWLRMSVSDQLARRRR